MSFAFRCLLGFLLLTESVFAQYTVERAVGVDHGSGYTDGAGLAARLDGPRGIAIDAAGNLYVADDQGTIRRITQDGRVSTLAGLAGTLDPKEGHGADAGLGHVIGLAIGPDHNLYAADQFANKIWKITPRGDVTTFASISRPVYIAFDSLGNLFATCLDRVIRKVTPAGVVTSFAGPSGFGTLKGIAIDEDDTLYVVDQGMASLRKIAATGAAIASYATPTIMPSHVSYDGHGGLWLSGGNVFFKLDRTGQVLWYSYQPAGVQFVFKQLECVQPAPNGDLFVSDANSIRRLRNGTLTTIAGTPTPPVRPSEGSIANVSIPDSESAAYDHQGNLFVGNTDGKIRKITPDGIVSIFASGIGHVTDLVCDSLNNVYVADSHANVIRKITPGGSMSVFAGQIDQYGMVNGVGTAARFATPYGITIDSSNNLYVIDLGNHQVRRITPASDVTTYVGTTEEGTADGPVEVARFTEPYKIGADPSGNLYVIDGARVRKVATDRSVSTFAGAIAAGFVDGVGTDARFENLFRVRADATGVYVFDSNMIRKISLAGEVTTVAGFHGRGGEAEGTGSIARLAGIGAFATDGNGNLVLADVSFSLYRVRPAGIEDRATASSLTPATYDTVQLGTDTNTATKWTWSVLRRPAGSTAELSATDIRNPTFAPDVAGDLFILMLRVENPSGVRYSVVELRPVDTCAPLSSAVVSMYGSAELCESGTGGTASVATIGGGDLSYQWGWRATPEGETHAIPGATLPAYTLLGSDLGGVGAKHLVVTVTSSCGGSITSSPFAINVRAPLANVAITVPLPVYPNNDTQLATVADAGFGATYEWSITNGTIVSGQGTRAIRFAPGASGDVTLQVTVTTTECPDTGTITAPITTGAMLYVITPCRVIDSRNSTSLAANSTREVVIAGTCGIPVDAKSVVVNTTAITPPGPGWLSLYAADLAWPGVSTVSYRTGRTRASSAVVKLSSDGRVNVKNGGPATHFVIDATGYFK